MEFRLAGYATLSKLMETLGQPCGRQTLQELYHEKLDPVVCVETLASKSGGAELSWEYCDPAALVQRTLHLAPRFQEVIGTILNHTGCSMECDHRL